VRVAARALMWIVVALFCCDYRVFGVVMPGIVEKFAGLVDDLFGKDGPLSPSGRYSRRLCCVG
jgi:hypothetical protein